MANASTLIQLGMAAIALCVLIVAVIFGFNLFRNSRLGDSSGLFSPRSRRLSFIERASLDGGRKLLLIRRDNIEHLVMIGGPIDIVVETGIQAPAFNNLESSGAYDNMSHYPVMGSDWRQSEASGHEDRPALTPELSVHSKSRLPEDETLELTQFHETKVR